MLAESFLWAHAMEIETFLLISAHLMSSLLGEPKPYTRQTGHSQMIKQRIILTTLQSLSNGGEAYMLSE